MENNLLLHMKAWITNWANDSSIAQKKKKKIFWLGNLICLELDPDSLQ